MFRLRRKKRKEIDEGTEVEIEEIDSVEEKRRRRLSAEHMLAIFFTVNAIVMSMLGSIILKVSMIAVRYYDRIMAINANYTTYVDISTYIAGVLFIYAVFNVLAAAYYLYEAKIGIWQ